MCAAKAISKFAKQKQKQKKSKKWNENEATTM